MVVSLFVGWCGGLGVCPDSFSKSFKIGARARHLKQHGGFLGNLRVETRRPHRFSGSGSGSNGVDDAGGGNIDLAAGMDPARDLDGHLGFGSHFGLVDGGRGLADSSSSIALSMTIFVSDVNGFWSRS